MTRPPATIIYVAAFVLTGMATTVLGPILPVLLQAWHLSDAAAGALFTAQFSGSLCAGALSGMLVARFAAARILALGYVTMGVGLLALIGGGYRSGVAGALAIGVGMGLVIPPTNLIVARAHRERAASALAALNLAWGVGAALWPLLVWLSARVGGMRPAVVALALLCAVAGSRILRQPAASGSGAADDGAVMSPAAPRVALFAAVIFLYSGTEMALGGWLPELARRLPAAASGSGSIAAGAAFWGGLAVGRGLIAVRLDRRYESTAIFTGLTLTSISIVLLTTARVEVTVLAAAALSGLGLGPVFPVTAAALSREVPVRLAGPLLALGSLGGATMPWLVGVLSDRIGSLVTAVASLLVVVVVLFGLHLRRLRG